MRSIYPLGSASAAEPTVHLGYLDSLRGIAILGVIFVHCALIFIPVSNQLVHVVLLGQRGVQLFYLVSAFTLFYTLDRPRAEQHPTISFYIRRFFRIAPLFYVAILVHLLVNGFSSGLHWYHLVSGAFFANGASPFAIGKVAPGSWSVEDEACFYLLVPLLFRSIRSVRSAILGLALGTAVLVPFSFLLALKANNEYFSFLWFPIEFPVFLLGILTYMIWKTFILPYNALKAGAIAENKRVLSALLLIVCIVVLLSNLNLNPAPARIPWRNVHMLPASFMFVPLILALSLHQWKLLVNPFTRLMGKISYSVYFAHAFMIEGLTRLASKLAGHTIMTGPEMSSSAPLNSALLFIATLAVSIPVCIFLWEYVEQPGIRLGRRTVARLEHRSATRAILLTGNLEELTDVRNTPDAQF